MTTPHMMFPSTTRNRPLHDFLKKTHAGPISCCERKGCARKGKLTPVADFPPLHPPADTRWPAMAHDLHHREAAVLHRRIYWERAANKCTARRKASSPNRLAARPKPPGR